MRFLHTFSFFLHSLLPGTRNKHRGPRGGGVTKSKSKKSKGSMKLSMLRRESLFGGTADDAGSMTGPYVPSERSKDTHTDAEIADLMAWVHPRPFPLPSLSLTYSLHRPTAKLNSIRSMAQHTPSTNRRHLVRRSQVRVRWTQLHHPMAMPGTCLDRL